MSMKWLRLAGLWCGLAAAAAMAADVSPPADTVSREEAKATIERFLKCWETGDAETFAGLLHPALVFGYPGGRLDRAGLIKVFADYHREKGDIRIYFGDTFVSDGRRHILPYQFAATDLATGRRFAVGTGTWCEFADGKIVRFREYFDSTLAERQKKGELPVDEGVAPNEPVTPWPKSMWLRVDTIN